MIDTNSDTWIEIDKEVTNKIEKLTNRILNLSTPHDQTMYIRGCIATLKEIKELPNNHPVKFVEIDIYN